MKLKILAILFLLISCLCATGQEIMMPLGGQTHTGVYYTEPLREFSKVLWKTEIKGRGKQDCIIQDGILYASSVERHSAMSLTGHIYAIELNSGNIKWENEIKNSNVSSPTIKDSIIYYGSDDINGTQYAANLKTGEVLWTFKTEGRTCWPPAIIGDKNFFGCHGDKLYVLNNNSGELIHERHIDGGICNCASIKDGVIYFIDLNGTLHAMNAETYKDIWTFKSGAKSYNSPAIVDNDAFFINNTGTVFSVDIETGKLNWTFKGDDAMTRSPAVKDNIATLITNNGHIYALNTQNGSLMWEHNKPGLGYTNPAIVEDIAYFGCADNNLYAFELKTGKELWKFETDSPVNTPVVDKGIIIFTSGNHVYALK